MSIHSTLHPSIKGYIDKTNNVNDNITIIGWAFHNKYAACKFRLRYSLNDLNDSRTIEMPSQNRKDVGKYYKRNDIDTCGFKFTIPSIMVYSLDMFFDNKWNTFYIFNKENVNSENIELRNTYIELENIEINNTNAELVEIDNNKNIITPNNIPTFLVSDNFYSDPYAVRNFALSKSFIEHKNYHKGKRTEEVYLFDGLQQEFERLMGRTIKNFNKYGTNGCFQYCIAGDQLVYHCDTQDYAGVLFLSPDAPPQTGTTLYRSKHTKEMTVNTSEHPIVFKNGFLDPTEFEVVDVVGNVFNRLVLFNSRLIHAASSYFGNNVENGRLFQLFFFDLEPLISSPPGPVSS